MNQSLHGMLVICAVIAGIGHGHRPKKIRTGTADLLAESFGATCRTQILHSRGQSGLLGYDFNSMD